MDNGADGQDDGKDRFADLVSKEKHAQPTADEPTYQAQQMQNGFGYSPASPFSLHFVITVKDKSGHAPAQPPDDEPIVEIGEVEDEDDHHDGQDQGNDGKAFAGAVVVGGRCKLVR